MNAQNTSLHYTLLVTRLVLAFVTAAHGIQKLFGWFGGYGFDGTMGFFTQTIGLPYFLGMAIIAVETVGMIALALGLGSRIWAGFVIVIMAGAIFSVHASNGFYMNWGGTLSGEGYEYHIVMIALAIPTIVLGSGAFSLDAFLWKSSRPINVQA